MSVNQQAGGHLRMQSILAKDHLEAAVQFAESARSIEEQHTGRSAWKQEHRSYALAGVIHIVAFLEAAANEFFTDASEKAAIVAHLGEPTLTIIGQMWKLDVPRTAKYRVLEKYEIALEQTGKPSLSATAEAGIVDAMVTLRNDMIHYEPEWLPTSTGKPISIEKKMRGKFETCRLFNGAGNPFYPDHCLGYGCLQWGINGCVMYADRFFDSLSIKPPYRIFPAYAKVPLSKLTPASTPHVKPPQ